MNLLLKELAFLVSEAQIGTYRDFFRILDSYGIPKKPPFPEVIFDSHDCFNCLGLAKKQKYADFLNEYNYKKIQEFYNSIHCTVISCVDTHYPSQLFHLSSPPVCLYIRGNYSRISWDIHDLFSIVGSRKPSPYGKACTEMVVSTLVSSGFQIVSGLAYGIDAIAHASTIQQKGKTIAVIAGGIDSLYPKRNEALGKSIIDEHGVVISEYPAGTAIQSWMFPERNRIIAALSCEF